MLRSPYLMFSWVEITIDGNFHMENTDDSNKPDHKNYFPTINIDQVASRPAHADAGQWEGPVPSIDQSEASALTIHSAC